MLSTSYKITNIMDYSLLRLIVGAIGALQFINPLHCI